MKEIIADTKLISRCGLYCGACKKYINGKCPGCNEKTNAQWCKVRTCVEENAYTTCADCTICKLEECKKLNNFVAKVFSIIFRSDRDAGIKMIREKGAEAFVEYLVKEKAMAIKRK